ncbi:glutamate receptor 2.1-like [Senna tora]|uniref:Glutamate receptor 2.1-like n=1 Tax=Senna tora TaxID=362788 RepID=A0A834U103_9FABA|nr:glutamate receptor 2.1-like [Senna tora]
MVCEAETKAKVGVKVGIVLDFSSNVGKMGLSCINMSLSDFYVPHSHYKTRLILNLRDSHTNVVTAASQG